MSTKSLPRTYRPGIYEATISPEEALSIVENTIETDANFRSPYKAQPGHETSPGYAVSHYRNAMESGRWEWTNASPIRMHHDESGRIVCTDGMHRLAACYHSDIPLQAIVMFGIEYAAGVETDRGKSRTLTQVLQHKGVGVNAQLVAASTRLAMLKAVSVELDVTVSHAAMRVHIADVVDLYQDNESVMRWAASRASAHRNMGGVATAYGTLLLVVPERKEIDEELTNVLEADPGNPWLAAVRAYTHHQARTGRNFSTPVCLQILVRSYNAWISGEPLKVIKPGHMGSAANLFPIGVDHREFLPASMKQKAQP